MMNDIPWIELAYALGPVLAVVGAYEFLVVRPLRRRVAELADRATLLGRSLKGVARLSARLVSAERRLGEQLRQSGERLGQVELRSNSRPYEQAIGLAKRGERAERLVSCFGLAEAEANLISLLHGGRVPRPGPPQGVRGRPDPVRAQRTAAPAKRRPS